MTTPLLNRSKDLFDPAHDVYQYTQGALEAIFAPKNVAVIGATEKEGSVGRTILWNLISSPFGGAVFPINPKRSSLLGIKAYPSIKDVPDTVDLAVIVTPSSVIPGLIEECGEMGVKGVIVISAGFKEIGPEGVELERQLLENARKYKIRVVGPNCLGVMSPVSGLNATFAAGMARKGNVAFISQSGALCTAVLDWSFKENVGFSHFVSVGSMLDVDWGDLIYYLGDDPHTESIVIYMESIGNARSFLSAAREVALTKPIIVIKPGRTEGAARAAASHTGSLTGSDEVLDVAFRRAGVLRVNNISEIFSMAEVLGRQPRPKGPRLTILTNAGGPGVLATDTLLTTGGELAEVSQETMDKLSEFLPSAWSHNNPIDIIGDASPERYAKSLEVAAQDPNSDGLLVILTPQAMTDPTATAEALKAYAKSYDKPILASWSGGQEIAAGEAILNKAGIPTFAYPDEAARAFTYMWQSTYALKTLYETPSVPEDAEGQGPDRQKAHEIIETARKSGRTLLTEVESKELLGAYGIPVTPMLIATSPEECAAKSKALGFPVVIKIHSETITHKTDVGGVKLNIKDEAAAKTAYEEIRESVTRLVSAKDFLGVTIQPMVKMEGYELIVGSSIDSQFGPVLLFGMGGQLVEVFKDRALSLPPLNTTLARRMIERTKIFHALKGVRGRKPVDLAKLEKLMVRFSQLVVEQPWIAELDINPLIASPEGLLALDARVLLHDLKLTEDQLPKLAIRPYPNKYVGSWTMKDGREVSIRPIRAEDEPMMRKFHEALSDRSVYLRYLSPMVLSERVTHERLARMTHNDYDREIALVVEGDEEAGEKGIFGIARLSKFRGENEEARFTMLVNDKFQGQGLGKELLSRLLDVARAEKIKRVIAIISPENEAMQKICRDLGFSSMQANSETGMIEAEISL
ncbi:MAG: bifunctional acetate--CoA ligase family protein/GNAT family N-acetyltransferase [Anaerolineales bacterium]|jgi:acetyltransferase|nr:bifunctional acetate--CoA ligase family protein/GNAT family N-acetyltransferase [Anaerolineales bacterium]